MPVGNITLNHGRFENWVKRYIKNNITQYLINPELLSKQRGETISLFMPTVRRFAHETKTGGVGQGEGEVGDFIDYEENEGGTTLFENGREEIKLGFPVSELEDVILEEVGLSDLKLTGKLMVDNKRFVEKGISKKDRRRHFQRTYKEALKRHLMSGDYDQTNPCIAPVGKDLRYYAHHLDKDRRHSNAVIFYLRACSVDEEGSKLFEVANNWVERLMRRYYENLEKQYIVHASKAYHGVTPERFYRVRSNEKSKASSALEKELRIVREEYPSNQWDIYTFYCSDGENDKDDTDKTLALLGNVLVPITKMFCYAQCGHGKLVKYIQERFSPDSSKQSVIAQRRIRCSLLLDNDDILKTLRTFLNKDQVPFHEAGDRP